MKKLLSFISCCLISMSIANAADGEFPCTITPTVEQMAEFQDGNILAVESYVGEKTLMALEYKIEIIRADGEFGKRGASTVVHYYRVIKSNDTHIPVDSEIIFMNYREVSYPEQISKDPVYIIRPWVHDPHYKGEYILLRDDAIFVGINASPEDYLRARRAVDARKG